MLAPEGNSVRSAESISEPVETLTSKMEMWVFGSAAKCRVIPRPMPDAPPGGRLLDSGLECWEFYGVQNRGRA